MADGRRLQVLGKTVAEFAHLRRDPRQGPAAPWRDPGIEFDDSGRPADWVFVTGGHIHGPARNMTKAITSLGGTEPMQIPQSKSFRCSMLDGFLVRYAISERHVDYSCIPLDVYRAPGDDRATATAQANEIIGQVWDRLEDPSLCELGG